MRRTLALLLTLLLTASSQHNGTRVGFGYAPRLAGRRHPIYFHHVDG